MSEKSPNKFLKGTKTFLKITLEIFAIIVGLAFVFVAILAVRLNSGPLKVPYLADTIRDTLDNSDLAYNVEFKDLSLYWPGLDQPVLLSLEEVKLKNQQGLRLASVAEIAVNLSTEGLLNGYIHPSKLLIQKPDIYLTRNKDGAFALNLRQGDNQEDKQAENTIFRNLTFGEILDIASGHKNFSGDSVSSKMWFERLERIEVLDGVLKISDLKKNQFWNIPNFDFNFSRMDKGFGGELDFEIKINNKNIPVSSKVFYQRTLPADAKKTLDVSEATQPVTGVVDWVVSIEHLNVKDLIKRFEALNVVEGSDLDLGMNFQIKVNRKLDIKALSLKAKTDEGTLQIQDVIPNPLPFKKFSSQITYDDQSGIAEISEMKFVFDNDEVVSAKLLWDLNKVEDNFSVDGLINQMTVPSVLKAWPKTAQPKAREWVEENIKDGNLEKAFVNLKASVNLAEENKFQIDNLTGGFAYSDMVMQYLPDFPFLTELQGVSTFNTEEFKFDVKSAKLENLNIGGAEIKIYNFDHTQHPKELIDMKITDVTGKASELTKLLAKEPLDLLSPIEKKPEDFKGEFKGGLTLSFPLDKDLQLEDIKYGASATATGFSLRRVFEEYDLSDADLVLEIDPKAMNVTGQGKVQGVLLKDLKLKMDISGNDPIETSVSFDTNVNATQIGNFLPDQKAMIEQIVQGDLSADFKYSGYREGDDIIDLSVDLTKASLKYEDFLGFKKDKDSDFGVTLRTVFKDKIIKVESVKAYSTKSKIDLDLSADFSKDYQFKSAKINKFKFEKNNFTGEVKPLDGNKLQVSIKGTEFDARPFLKDDEEKPDDKKDDVKDATYYIIAAEFDRIYTVDDYMITDVKTYVESKGFDRFDRVEADLKMKDGAFRLRYKPNENTGLRRLKLQSDNLGSFLTHLGLSEQLKGGRVYVKATATKEKPDVLQGLFLIRDVVAIEVPVIASILNGMSLDGLSKILSNEDEGLLFKEISSKISIDESGRANDKPDIIKLREGKTKSDSLGLTFEGNIQPETDQIDLQGTVVPVDDINKFFANIPVLGDIITLGSRDAIFAATYSVKGKASDPSVSVNPLATLAPGFLRSLFFESNIDEKNFETD